MAQGLKVAVESNGGRYYKSFEDMYIHVDGTDMKLSDLVLEIKELREKNESLEKALKKAVKDEAVRTSMVIEAVEKMAAKITRIEQDLREE